MPVRKRGNDVYGTKRGKAVHGAKREGGEQIGGGREGGGLLNGLYRIKLNETAIIGSFGRITSKTF